MSEIEIRALEPVDLDAVVEIEKKSETTVWSREALLYDLEKNHFADYLGAYLSGKLIAYAGIWTILDESNVSNIAVSPEYQGLGYGKMLFEKLLELASFRGAEQVNLEVRVSNFRAINLYESYGFKTMGLRKNYYSDNNEDAFFMQKKFEG